MSVSTYAPDSTKILHTAYADFVSRQIGRTVHVVQYDDSLPLLAVKLFSDGQPYTIPSNADISIKLGKSDGKFVYNPALGCDSTRHIAYFEITYQMVVLAETVSPVIEVRIGASIAASSSIGIIIDRNPIQRDDIESTSEWKVIQQAIDSAKNVIDYEAKAAASRSAAAESETNAKTSEQNALTYKNTAQSAANSATNAANSASSSATNAANSASSASGSATTAANSATNAANSASYANTAATNASTSASKAATSEQNAKVSETNSKTSETNAKKSELNAANSEKNSRMQAEEADLFSLIAKSYAIGEGNYRLDEATDNAKYYSEKSGESMLEAKASEYNSDVNSLLARSYAVGDSLTTLGDGVNEIVTSDGFSFELFSREDEQTDNAKYYAEQAAKSAKNAYMSEKAANISEENTNISEQNARISALEAKASEYNSDVNSLLARSYAVGDSLTTLGDGVNEIVTSDGFSFELFSREDEQTDNAKYYAEQAKISSESIIGYKEASEEYAKITRSYAVGDTDYREEEAMDNAKYYYEQTKSISKGLDGAFLPMGTITFEELETQTKETGFTYNISNDFISDETFKDGKGKKYPAGTNVYWTADGYWDCLAGSLLLGIKGAAESEYRDGYVNITPENIGSYDKESVDTFISGLNNIIKILSDTVDTLVTRLTEVEDLSGFAHLVVDDLDSELVTSDNATIILSI